MSRRVLLVDSDVDALGELASALRARGLLVVNANGAFEAVEQAFKRRPDVVLAAREINEHSALTGAFEAVPELADTPLLFLAREDSDLGPDDVPRGDVDRIVSRISEASPRGSRYPSPQETRGDLQQVPLVDLLQLLSMNRRSGVLGITTPSGAGEVRLAGGEVIDAVYRRLEGEKALFRLLGEREGHFAFAPGEPSTVRRIVSTTSRLLFEAMRQVDEVRRRRADLAPTGEAFFLDDVSAEDSDLALQSEAMPMSRKPTTRPGPLLHQPPPLPLPRAPSSGSSSVPPTLRVADSDRDAAFEEAISRTGISSSPPASAEARIAVTLQISALLQIPHNLDELLDEVSAPDLLILEALAGLQAAGRVRRVSLADLTTPFATPEQLPVFRSLVTRLARPGFAPPPCFVIAASTRRMSTLAHAVRRISDAVLPPDPPPRVPLPRPLGVLRLGEGVDLALTGLPAEDAFSPTWPLALHGATAVIRLNDAGGEALEAHCQALELMLLDAESMMGSLDIGAPGQIAALLRSALEMVAGV